MTLIGLTIEYRPDCYRIAATFTNNDGHKRGADVLIAYGSGGREVCEALTSLAGFIDRHFSSDSTVTKPQIQ